MTVADSTADEYYRSDKDYVFAIAEALNEEARALDALGVSVIQFDEPVYSRQPDRAVELGIPALDRAAQGLKNAKAAVHVCYGYPHKGIHRERKESYPTIIAALETSSIDILSLEFEVSKMDPKVLRLCPSKTVMFGCIDVGHDEAAQRDRDAGACLRKAAGRGGTSPARANHGRAGLRPGQDRRAHRPRQAAGDGRRRALGARPLLRRRRPDDTGRACAPGTHPSLHFGLRDAPRVFGPIMPFKYASTRNTARSRCASEPARASSGGPRAPIPLR